MFLLYLYECSSASFLSTATYFKTFSIHVHTCTCVCVCIHVHTFERFFIAIIEEGVFKRKTDGF